MSRRFVFEGLDAQNGLERRLSMSGLVTGLSDGSTPIEDPKPEPDPGPLQPTSRRSSSRRCRPPAPSGPVERR